MLSNQISVLTFLSFTTICAMNTSCKARKQSDAEAKVAKAPTGSEYLERITSPSLKAAATKAINATARIVTSDGNCSGTIISPVHVVTAAHCFAEEGNHRILNDRTVTVYAGGYTHAGELLEFTSDFLVPVGRDWHDENFDRSDIAIIKITPRSGDNLLSVKNGDPITPVAIATRNLKIRNQEVKGDFFDEEITFEETGFVIGYGKISSSSAEASDRKLRIKDINFLGEESSRAGKKMIKPFVKQTISSHYPNRGGPCVGDSGGPTFLVRESEPILIGVNSSTAACDDSLFYYASDVRLAGPNADFLEKTLTGIATFTDGATVSSSSGVQKSTSATTPKTPTNRDNPVPEHSRPTPPVNPPVSPTTQTSICAFAPASNDSPEEINLCRSSIAPGKTFVGIRSTFDKTFLKAGFRFACMQLGNPINGSDLCPE